mmetsp:Transcript_7409/g.12508  ORF Transcript_7409/g.12508 Transcript_7409/m.12508 type:complete len:217 (+) Transcript_7409:319-969(+)
MRSSIDADSTAVLIVCSLTTTGSHTPISVMSASTPFSPSMPHVGLAPPACLARSCVWTRMMSAPQFSSRVRLITSRLVPAALYAPAITGSCSLDCSISFCASVISMAPPPGTSRGSMMIVRTQFIASPRLRSISLSTSFDAPRSTIEHALGASQSTIHVKYVSPIFCTSKRPQPLPMSFSWISEVRCTIVAPVARATRLLSVLRTRRNTEMFAFCR